MAEGEWDINKTAAVSKIPFEKLGENTFELGYKLRAGKVEANATSGEPDSITMNTGNYNDVGQLIFETVGENGVAIEGAWNINAGDDYFFIKESIPTVRKGVPLLTLSLFLIPFPKVLTLLLLVR